MCTSYRVAIASFLAKRRWKVVGALPICGDCHAIARNDKWDDYSVSFENAALSAISN
jgi:hypothetical protein